MSLGQTCFARVLLSLLIFAGYTQLAVSQTVVNQPDSFDELARSTLAQIGGELSIPGLREPVEVLRDEWGIPHIYAQNTDDLFMAQGYIMAQDRLWQMEMWRRWHEGRLAEIFGPAAFDYDLRTRQMMFRGPWDESEWTSYHPEGERIFTAYANGVNAFIEQNRDNLPVEFQLTGVVPDPWTARTVVLRWAQVGLSSVRGHAISEILPKKRTAAWPRIPGMICKSPRASTSTSLPSKCWMRCEPGTAILSPVTGCQRCKS